VRDQGAAENLAAARATEEMRRAFKELRPARFAPPGQSPRRIRQSRVRGWKMPGGAVRVASPSRWANPHRPARRSLEANTAAVAAYRDHLGAPS
jgi:hypothetical protein